MHLEMNKTFPLVLLACFALSLSMPGCGGDTPDYEDLEDIPIPSRDLESDTDTNTSDDSASDDAGTDTTPDTDTDDDSTTSTDDSDNPTDSDIDDDLTEYAVSDQESLLYAQIWKDESTLLSGQAHDHVIRAAEWTGTLQYNPDNLSECSISFELPVDEMRNDEPAMREFVGIDGEIDPSDRETIRQHMIDEDQLHASAHPTISFTSTGCEGEGGDSGELTVTGGLTIRGVTKNVSLAVTFQRDDNKLYSQGSIMVEHADFGFEPYSAILGAVANDKDIKIAFDVVGFAQ